ncbi:type II secretion system protein GspL [Piscinibacter gummiphilus]|uniref:Type II secretion system protein GspL n=1 Tax=Piscinibacter gummiphilus TaxID=946333 RepID=A0ABZ0CWD0_9BURK|nr:type II secretion system protein GspL [Piscinibacter gummiphilus]WOB09271.1 type II secretion system protein GspL [Piscinibacter gummiphilus]
MSTLVVQIPPRPHLQAREAAPAPEGGLSTEYDYVLTPDGLATSAQGRAPVALVPKAASAVAVLADADVSWHRITLPKAPAARLQAALVGVLEDALLEEASTVHIAVAPGASAGEPTWVAVVDRAWLTAELATLEKANIFIDRVVPMSWPDEPPSGHFAEVGDPSQGATLTWAHPDGVVQMNLQGTLARSLLPNPLPEGARWSATPATAAAAERWLGVPMTVMDWPQRALQASRSLWNLRQFTLARKNRGTRALRDLWRQFLTPAWKPARYGLATLVVVQLIGLNLWAGHQSRTMKAKRDAMVALLKQTHPHVSGVLDAPVQMRRETDTLRAAAGIPGENDLEPMLQAAANAWPGDRPPVDNLRFEQGRLTLSAAGWNPDQIEQFRNQLRPRGWQVDARDGTLTLSRAPAGLAAGRPL